MAYDTRRLINEPLSLTDALKMLATPKEEKPSDDRSGQHSRGVNHGLQRNSP